MASSVSLAWIVCAPFVPQVYPAGQANPSSRLGSETESDRDEIRGTERELRDFYGRAKRIIEQNQDLELSLPAARRRVRELLKDLRSWAKQSQRELTLRSHQYNHREEKDAEPASTDECPLFFAEELDELCPLDAMSSEIWGGTVVFCRYDCAPELP